MKRASLIIARRLPLVEQERPTRPDHKSSPPSFRGVRVDHSSVSLVLMCNVLLTMICLCCPIYFGHCIVCPSILFWLLLWYPQASHLTLNNNEINQFISF